MLEKVIICFIGLVMLWILIKIFAFLFQIILFGLLCLLAYRLFLVYGKNNKYKIKTYNRKSNIKF